MALHCCSFSTTEPLSMLPTPISSPPPTNTPDLGVVTGIIVAIICLIISLAVTIIITVKWIRVKKRSQHLVTPGSTSLHRNCNTLPLFSSVVDDDVLLSSYEHPEPSYQTIFSAPSPPTDEHHQSSSPSAVEQSPQTTYLPPHPPDYSAVSNTNDAVSDMNDDGVALCSDELPEQSSPTIFPAPSSPTYEHHQSLSPSAAEQSPQTTYLPPHPPDYSAVSNTNDAVSDMNDDGVALCSDELPEQSSPTIISAPSLPTYEHHQSLSPSAAEQSQTTYLPPHPPDYGAISNINDDGMALGSGELSEQSSQSPHSREGRKSTSHLPDSMVGQLKNLPAQDRIVPPCVKPTATLPHCTSQGIEYNDEWNDFTLKIPQGAIPEGESLTIDIGVALYGPFQYPEGLRPVSPVFWICVRDKKYFHFLKPVEVTLPHFLTLDGEEDVQSLGLAFLKGDHEMGWKQKTHFQQAEGTALFRPGSDYGVLHTHHFCYLCITSKKSKETIQKAKFRMFTTIPRVFATHNPSYAFFFVTFFLKTCLETIRQQIRNTKELPAGSFREITPFFQFAGDVSDPALEIEIPQQPPAGWTLGLEVHTKVIC